MTAALITPPAVEPVSLAEAKAFLKLDTTADDDLIGALIVAARAEVEALTRRVLITQTWRVYRDDWPASRLIRLPVNPVTAIGPIVVFGADGAASTLPSTAYAVDLAGAPARIRLLAGALGPGASLNGIEIDVTAGYGAGAGAVPAPLRQAILRLAAEWYEHRDGAAIGMVPAPLATEFSALIAPYRILRL